MKTAVCCKQEEISDVQSNSRTDREVCLSSCPKKNQ